MTTGRCWTVGPRPEFALAGVSSTRCRLQAICLPKGSCLGQDCTHPLRARDITRINRWAPPDFVSSQTINLPGYSKDIKVTTHTCASANMPDRRSVMFLLHDVIVMGLESNLQLRPNSWSRNPKRKVGATCFVLPIYLLFVTVCSRPEACETACMSCGLWVQLSPGVRQTQKVSGANLRFVNTRDQIWTCLRESPSMGMPRKKPPTPLTSRHEMRC